MSLDNAIAHFRARSLGLHRSECAVVRKIADGEFNPATGEIGPPTFATIYLGSCNVREMTWEGTDVVTADQEVRLQRLQIWLPVNTAIDEDDILTVTSSQYDAGIVGETYRITDIFLDGWQISRRAIGERISRGLEDW